MQHKEYNKLVKYTEARNAEGLRLPIMLIGEAGSSKSKSAEILAGELGLKFGYLPMTQQTTVSGLLGFRTPDGKISDSLLGKFYKEGGVFVLEECDAGNKNTLLALNAAIAGSHGVFAGRMVKRHKDFVLIATANTYGSTDSGYSSRSKLDTSFLTRFLVIKWGLDEELETSIINNEELDNIVKSARKEMFKLGYENLSMRDALSYKALVDIGIDNKEAAESTMFREVDGSQLNGIVSKLFDPIEDAEVPAEDTMSTEYTSNGEIPEGYSEGDTFYFKED